MIEIFQSVIALVDIPSLGIKAGARGAVVEIYEKPYPAFEVEFFDEDREPVGTISMRPDEIEAASVAKTRLAT